MMWRSVFMGVLAYAACVSWAQSPAPSAEELIEQLKVPRTRSLRNLVVEAAPAAPAAGGQPSSATATPTQTQPQTQPQTPTAVQSAAPGTSTATPLPSATDRPTASAPSLTLNVQFDFNSTQIQPQSYAALANLATALMSAELAQSRFLIEGHTDAKGSMQYNRRLSEQRALSVRDWLAAKGVSASHLAVVGKGASEPANPGDPMAPENRRVRIVNLE